MQRVPNTSAAAQPAQEKWVDAQAIQALSGIMLRARTVADGVLAGMHRSQRHGRSIEFAEHKVYSPGDETRHIDWKAFGKFDRYYVKRFIEETAMRCFLVTDVSSSMSYAGGAPGSLPGVMKADYAKTLCATLSYLLLRQADAVGCMTFAETSGPRVATRGGDRHLTEILEALEHAPVGGLTHPVESLGSLAAHVSKRSMVVACTDLLDSGKDVMGPLSALRTRGADVAILHILHPDEVKFPFDSVVRFLDLEGERTAQVDAPAIRNAYLEEVNTWLLAQQSAAHERGLDYHLVTTDTPPARALLEFLSPRRRGE